MSPQDNAHSGNVSLAPLINIERNYLLHHTDEK